ncbi:MAG: RnfABCDGE type electron transport complex subunit A [Oscillospiraceae bacterium]|jgi:electron transport complex protein RnfA|nr:RnfABCDGE type electron transport complex subunit A [Oscillospiraceae bacterium]
MKEAIMIFFTAILTGNFVLARFLGICPFLGVSKKINTAVGMSLAVIFVMAMATAATYPINVLLEAKNLAYLQTVVFILVIAALVQLVETALKRFLPALYRSLGIYLPLITTNCAVLGVVLLNVQESYGFGQSMMHSVGAGVGFLLAMVIFAGVRQRLENNDIPAFLQGLPSTLIAASLVSLSFLGFGGVIERMFA